MHDASLFVEVPNSLRHLEYDVTRQILAKVRELYDLMEQLASFHDCFFRAPANGHESALHTMIGLAPATLIVGTHVQAPKSSARRSR
jgi:hypothetical protein